MRKKYAALFGSVPQVMVGLEEWGPVEHVMDVKGRAWCRFQARQFVFEMR